MRNTPAPWTQGKASDSIVSASCVGIDQPDNDTEFYGGYVICESVHPCNRSLIMAAPDLLAACKAVRFLLFINGEVVPEELDKAITKAEGKVDHEKQ